MDVYPVKAWSTLGGWWVLYSNGEWNGSRIYKPPFTELSNVTRPFEWWGINWQGRIACCRRREPDWVMDVDDSGSIPQETIDKFIKECKKFIEEQDKPCICSDKDLMDFGCPVDKTGKCRSK